MVIFKYIIEYNYATPTVSTVSFDSFDEAKTAGLKSATGSRRVSVYEFEIYTTNFYVKSETVVYQNET